MGYFLAYFKVEDEEPETIYFKAEDPISSGPVFTAKDTTNNLIFKGDSEYTYSD